MASVLVATRVQPLLPSLPATQPTSYAHSPISRFLISAASTSSISTPFFSRFLPLSSPPLCCVFIRIASHDQSFNREGIVLHTHTYIRAARYIYTHSLMRLYVWDDAYICVRRCVYTRKSSSPLVQGRKPAAPATSSAEAPRRAASRTSSRACFLRFICVYRWARAKR